MVLLSRHYSLQHQDDGCVSELFLLWYVVWFMLAMLMMLSEEVTRQESGFWWCQE